MSNACTNLINVLVICDTLAAITQVMVREAYE
nr:MAG TPA: hypothetical protein [Caudoviricetes sp.]